MNILLYRWGAYNELDIKEELTDSGVHVNEIIYPVKDKHYDEQLQDHLVKLIKDSKYDAIFSVNYFPVVAKVCYKANLKYVSWTYDAPLNVTNIEETLGYSTNYVFMFDRLQAGDYISRGFDNVFHMPLAVNTRRYDKIVLSERDKDKYCADVSFVGNLYSDILGAYVAPLTDYQKGYIEALCVAQKELYGSYILDELINDQLISEINKRYKEVKPDTEIVMSKEALSFAMSSNITRTERLTLLGIISRYFDLKYFSGEKTEILKDENFCGTVDYYSDMPKVFKAGKVNLNITLKILKSGIPLRALDIMGCGGFLLSNYQPELAEMFINEQEVVMYESIEDAFEKTKFYLANSKIREKIALNGYKKVKEDFSYAKQLGKIFKYAGLLN